MKIGIIGIGKMGTAIAFRLAQADQKIILYDANPIAPKTLSTLMSANIADTMQELGEKSDIIWIMVPPGEPTEQVINQLLPHVTPKKIVIDGGNSHYTDSIRRAQLFKKLEVDFLDCGTSGGLYGVEHGFSLTVGGCVDAFDRAEIIFKALSVAHGYMYTGESGSGHYVKMVHNGIEYGLMESYAEGISLLHDGYFKNLNLAAITCTWRHGAIIDSFILKLLSELLAQDSELKDVVGIIGQTGTGQWTVEEAKKHHIRVPVIKTSLEERLKSPEHVGAYTNKVIAMLRHKLGGHPVVMAEHKFLIDVSEKSPCQSTRGHAKKAASQNEKKI